MADDERPETEDDVAPSLELPSLRSAFGLGRKRRAKRSDAPREPDEPAAPPIEPVASDVPEPAAPPDTVVVAEPAPATGPAAPAPAATQAEPAAPVEPPPPREAGEPAAPLPPEVAVEPGPHLSPGPVGLPETQPHVDPTAVLPAAMTASDEEADGARRSRRRPRIPVLHLPGWLVALVTGAVVGVVLVGLTSTSLQACSAVRGTSSCGKPGILVLLVITVAMVFLGALLLRLAGVPTSGSTSFLGVGLLVVVILLALLPVIFHWWMVLVIPAVAMLTYAVSWWLTSTYVEPGERAR